ncbi:hypothetical protein [Adhaeribacter aquaticus]|uniref:hypothetical protein n=1 Tax=Adhaeribacter aquaticus TaxID=299567 RepID=UPI000420B68B|nr:hypothetical protein [Adhaeribacter aquaticus]
MKSSLITLALTIVVTVTGFAYSLTGQHQLQVSIEQAARVQVRQMQESIRFNEFEYIQIKKLTGAYLAAVQQVKQTTAADQQPERIAQLEAAYKAAIAGMLTEVQKQAFATYAAAHSLQSLLAAK